MRTQAEIRSWLQAAMEEAGISPTELASRAKVHRSTIFRILSDDYEFIPSTKTLDKLTIALVDANIEGGLTRSFRHGPVIVDDMAVELEIGRGIWIEKDDITTSGTSPLKLHPNIPRNSQTVGRVANISSGEGYEVGDLVHILTKPYLNRSIIFPGQHVVMRRFLREADVAEVTIWEVLSVDEGLSMEVRERFPSRGAELAVRRLAPAEEVQEGPHLISLYGIVLGQYRARHFLTRLNAT